MTDNRTEISSIGEFGLIERISKKFHSVHSIDPKSIGKVMEFLKENYPQVDSLQYVVNTKGNDPFRGPDLIQIYV